MKRCMQTYVRFKETDSLKEILKVAQRIESGLKELKKSEIAILDLDDEDEDSANVGILGHFPRSLTAFIFISNVRVILRLQDFICHPLGHNERTECGSGLSKCLDRAFLRNRGILIYER